MRSITVILALGVSLLFAFQAHANPIDDLRAIVTQVVADERMEDTPSASNAVKADIQKLTTLIESGNLDQIELAIAHFYRGEASGSIATGEQLHLIQADGSEANTLRQSALSDMKYVISSRVEAPEWGVSKPDAEYVIASLLLTFDPSSPDTGKYFSDCAKSGQIACMNVMANFDITGENGQRVDPEEAVALNTKVYETGTKYSCAGAFSAALNAQITYFYKMKAQDGDPILWVERADRLSKQVAPMYGGKDVCGHPYYEITEFLIRLSRGETRTDLLTDIVQNEKMPEEKIAARYLEGSITDKEFQGRIAAMPKPDRCDWYFVGLWHGHIIKRPDLVKAYFAHLSDIGPIPVAISNCAVDLAFARTLEPAN